MKWKCYFHFIALVWFGVDVVSAVTVIRSINSRIDSEPTISKLPRNDDNTPKFFLLIDVTNEYPWSSQFHCLSFSTATSSSYFTVWSNQQLLFGYAYGIRSTMRITTDVRNKIDDDVCTDARDTNIRFHDFIAVSQHS